MIRRLLAVAALVVAMATLGPDSVSARGPAEVQGPTIERAARIVELFPHGDYFPDYIADLHRPGFGLVRMRASGDGIADSGAARFNLKLGAHFGLVRVARRGESARGWQLGLVAGLDAIFDVDRDYDNIGWDGNYGLVLSGSFSRRAAWKLGAVHTSSHVGDEYAERTGRLRIGYTREELVAGVAWRYRPSWLGYLEAGWGYDLRNEDLQRPARVQVGIEHERDERLWAGRLGWYAAADLSATEETDWRPDSGLQLGVAARAGAQRWRFGVELYRGRPPLGEFFQDRETYVGLGLWMDL